MFIIPGRCLPASTAISLSCRQENMGPSRSNSSCQCPDKDPATSKKDWYQYFVRSLSRVASGKDLHRKQEVWTEDSRPDFWPASYKHKWRNPSASKDKDTLDVLKDKFHFLEENLRERGSIPPELDAEIMLWNSGKFEELYSMTLSRSILKKLGNAFELLEKNNNITENALSDISQSLLKFNLEIQKRQHLCKTNSQEACTKNSPEGTNVRKRAAEEVNHHCHQQTAKRKPPVSNSNASSSSSSSSSSPASSVSLSSASLSYLPLSISPPVIFSAPSPSPSSFSSISPIHISSTDSSSFSSISPIHISSTDCSSFSYISPIHMSSTDSFTTCAPLCLGDPGFISADVVVPILKQIAEVKGCQDVSEFPQDVVLSKEEESSFRFMDNFIDSAVEHSDDNQVPLNLHQLH